MATQKKQKSPTAAKENATPASKSGKKAVSNTTKAKAAAKEAGKVSQVKDRAKKANMHKGPGDVLAEISATHGSLNVRGVSTKGPQKGKKASDDKDAEIARLRAENATLRKVSTEQEEPKIPRPPSAGRNIPLRTAMELDDDSVLYNAIRRTVLRLADRGGLDHHLLWLNQPKEKIVRICQLAGKEQPYLKRFAHNWAMESILKSICKHRRDYSKRPGVNIQVSNRESDKETDADVAMDVDESSDENDESGKGSSDEHDNENGKGSGDESDNEGSNESGNEDSNRSGNEGNCGNSDNE